MLCRVTPPPQFYKKKNATYNQDKCSQEFCQEFLEYSMFECTVLPHASLVLCFSVSLLFELPDV